MKKSNCVKRLIVNRIDFVRAFSMALSVIVFILALTAGSAWSLDFARLAYSDGGTGTGPEYDTLPSSLYAEACLPLLEASYAGTLSVSNEDEVRPSAGKVKAVVLGIVLGARFALTPVNYPEESSDYDSAQASVSQPPYSGDTHVLAVSAYRSCMKEAALKERTRIQREL